MKIEIAENMLYSWLRHCKGCQIVQTNFKVSKFWSQNNEQEMETLYDKFQTDERFSDFHFTARQNLPPVFATTLNFTECDLLGLSFDEENASTVYAVESAFHENGLNYNDTQKKVVQKFFKNYLMAKSFFPNSDVELLFISPKIGNTTLNLLNENIEKLKAFFSENNCEVNLKIVSNEEFQSMILRPLCELIDEIADESELFVRAVKLWRLAEVNPVRQNRIRRVNVAAPNNAVVANQAPLNVDMNELKVGFIVKTRLYDLLKSGMLSEDEISNLKDPEYCHRVFNNLHFPVLRQIEFGRTDGNGRTRFYVDVIRIGDESYYVTNDWYERNKSSLLRYLAEHNA